MRSLLRRCRSWTYRCLDDYLPLVDRPRFRYQSETANDRWVVETVFPGLRDGYFVEAGAANGIGGSSCYVLESELGWRGICVEPHPDFAREMRTNRPKSKCFEVCLGDTEGEVEYLAGTDGPGPYLSGVRDNLERYKTGSAEGILKTGKSLRLPMRTLPGILDEVHAPAVIDYAAFDMEGSELPVLSTFPFDRYRFRAVTVECDTPTWRPMTELFKENGYREVTNPFNRSRPWERYWLSD